MYKFPAIRLLCCLFLCLVFSSCHKSAPKQITASFYYWKPLFRLDTIEKSYLGVYPIPLLYIRFFDVAWDNSTAQPVPRAPLRFAEKPDPALRYIPVVFITNETLQHCSPEQIDRLSVQVLEKINTLAQHFDRGYTEVQLDCDWNLRTREKYFLLLHEIGKKLHQRHIRLSATLRLHQIKYADRTGIPPVDRGMLMCYNMGDWQSPQTRNSIYDLQTAGRYLSHIKDYPLPLDMALPLLRWTIVYRNHKFLTFINDVASDDLAHCTFLNQLRDHNHYTVNRDTFAYGCNLRRGDLLRSEACNIADLREGKQQLFHRIRNTRLTMTLFHLDDRLLKHYTHAQIQKLFAPLP